MESRMHRDAELTDVSVATPRATLDTFDCTINRRGVLLNEALGEVFLDIHM